jgi:7-carboxy-7-deazaguanine synthase
MDLFSIFDSIDGEVNAYGQGHPTTFIRMAGCNLNPPCLFCDTKYAQDSEHSITVTPRAVFQDVVARKPYKVTITGGEPLVQQEELQELVELLRMERIFITIETNGSYPIPKWPGCSWIADWKLKGSGVHKAMKISNFILLSYMDYVKFVVSSRADYEEAKVVRRQLHEAHVFARQAMSPVMPGLKPASLISWMQQDRLNDVLVNIQIHKLLDLSEDNPEKEHP